MMALLRQANQGSISLRVLVIAPRISTGSNAVTGGNASLSPQLKSELKGSFACNKGQIKNGGSNASEAAVSADGLPPRAITAIAQACRSPSGLKMVRSRCRTMSVYQ